MLKKVSAWKKRKWLDEALVHLREVYEFVGREWAREEMERALNRPVAVEFRRAGCVAGKDEVRQCADHLLAYLQLANQSGRWRHVICGIAACGKVVQGGRGNKRFCSDECRTVFWNEERKASRRVRRG